MWPYVSNMACRCIHVGVQYSCEGPPLLLSTVCARRAPPSCSPTPRQNTAVHPRVRVASPPPEITDHLQSNAHPGRYTQLGTPSLQSTFLPPPAYPWYIGRLTGIVPRTAGVQTCCTSPATYKGEAFLLVSYAPAGLLSPRRGRSTAVHPHVRVSRVGPPKKYPRTNGPRAERAAVLSLPASGE